MGKGTILLIDETHLGTGQLNERGVRSLSALQNIAMTQHLPMSYPYYELKVPTDLPLILFTATKNGSCLIASDALKIVLQNSSTSSSSSSYSSSSSSSLFNSTNLINSVSHTQQLKEVNNQKTFGLLIESNGIIDPRSLDSSTSNLKDCEKGVEKEVENEDEREIEKENVWEGESDEVWKSRARQWWATVRENDVVMKEEVAISGIESFATARQTDTRLTQADFHRWLTISRLIAISEGSTEINWNHWNKMREIEGVRLDRYSSL